MLSETTLSDCDYLNPSDLTVVFQHLTKYVSTHLYNSLECILHLKLWTAAQVNKKQAQIMSLLHCVIMYISLMV